MRANGDLVERMFAVAQRLGCHGILTRDKVPVADLTAPVEQIVVSRLEDVPSLVVRFLSGAINVF